MLQKRKRNKPFGTVLNPLLRSFRSRHQSIQIKSPLRHSSQARNAPNDLRIWKFAFVESKCNQPHATVRQRQPNNTPNTPTQATATRCVLQMQIVQITSTQLFCRSGACCWCTVCALVPQHVYMFFFPGTRARVSSRINIIWTRIRHTLRQTNMGPCGEW